VKVYQLLNFIWMILRAQRQTVGDKTLISGLHWYVSDWYGLLITVGCVGGGFSQIGVQITRHFGLKHCTFQTYGKNRKTLRI